MYKYNIKLLNLFQLSRIYNLLYLDYCPRLWLVVVWLSVLRWYLEQNHRDTLELYLCSEDSQDQKFRHLPNHHEWPNKIQ